MAACRERLPPLHHAEARVRQIYADLFSAPGLHNSSTPSTYFQRAMSDSFHFRPGEFLLRLSLDPVRRTTFQLILRPNA